MKRIKNLIISMLAVVLLVGMTSFALGASVNTSIVPEKSKVKAGETFTVTVKFSGGDVGRVKALMDYDSTKLSYLGGGSSEGDNGTISIRKAGDGKDITAKLKFKALNSGKTSLNISRLEAYDLDEQKLEGTKADTSADAVLEAGFKPDMIVGDMDSVSDSALECGAEIIIIVLHNYLTIYFIALYNTSM